MCMSVPLQITLGVFIIIVHVLTPVVCMCVDHILSNMQDCLPQLMQLIQLRHMSLFSTVIANHVIGEDFMRLWDLMLHNQLKMRSKVYLK